jgi:hypothetical protein
METPARFREAGGKITQTCKVLGLRVFAGPIFAQPSRYHESDFEQAPFDCMTNRLPRCSRGEDWNDTVAAFKK